jgi:hypothetical protein
MVDETLVSTVKNTILHAKNMITYFDYPSEAFTMTPRGQKVITRKSTLFQVNFPTHADAQAFADSIFSLGLDTVVTVYQLASGDYQAYFDL